MIDKCHKFALTPDLPQDSKVCPSTTSTRGVMVCTFLKVDMDLCSSFLFLQEQIKDIIIICVHVMSPPETTPSSIRQTVVKDHCDTVWNLHKGLIVCYTDTCNMVHHHADLDFWQLPEHLHNLTLWRGELCQSPCPRHNGVWRGSGPVSVSRGHC